MSFSNDCIKSLVVNIWIINQNYTVFFVSFTSAQQSPTMSFMSRPSTLDGSIISHLSDFSGTPPSDITKKCAESHHPSVSLNILDFLCIEIDTQWNQQLLRNKVLLRIMISSNTIYFCFNWTRSCIISNI